MRDQGRTEGQQEGLPRYALTARFHTPGRAKVIYEQLQAALYRAEESDLSAYNLQLNGTPFVAVVGKPPPAALHEHLRQILAVGSADHLPEEVLALLFWGAAKRRCPPDDTALREGWSLLT